MGVMSTHCAVSNTWGNKNTLSAHTQVMCPSLTSAKHTSFKGLNQIVDLSNSHQYQNIDPNTKKIEDEKDEN